MGGWEFAPRPANAPPGGWTVTTSDDNELLSFHCIHCGKRIKAPARLAGRQAKCPRCNEQLSVPTQQEIPSPRNRLSSQDDETSSAPSSTFDDPFQLQSPAIADSGDRQRSADAIKAVKDEARRAARSKRTSKTTLGKVEPVGTGPAPPSSESAPPDGVTTEPQTPQTPQGSPASTGAVKRSLFDDDLPELEQLQEEPSSTQDVDSILAAHIDATAASGNPPPDAASLDDHMPDVAEHQLPPLDGTEAPLEAEYRIVCNTCGTPQYVSPSAKGMKIKCPDCFTRFRVPPPPAGWSNANEKAKSKKNRPTVEHDIPRLSNEELSDRKSDDARQDQTQKLLQRAKEEIAEETGDDYYGIEFDTTGFFQRTFGFVTDPITIAQVLIFGFVFAAIFSIAQFSANDTQGFFGRGMLLVSTILVPAVGILFALPMLSGGLALIESVANKQKRVTEFPAFNMFDNVGDVILISTALAAAAVPGYLVGSWLAGEPDAATYYGLAGMMISTLLLFPFFLLSMMDNGSLFAPISGAVMRSLTTAAEAWGGYYLKTFAGFFSVLIAWFVLLSMQSIAMTGLAGSLLPLLVFFTCQQLGVLADAIGDQLSIEFEPEVQKDEGSSSREEIDET